MTYIDGFLLPLPEDNISAYTEMSTQAGKVWMEHGALAYKEAVIDDDNIMNMISFTDSAKAKPGEKAVFAFILFKDRVHRDEVNAKVMADPRINEHCNSDNMPFDVSRMAYGGFSTIVDM